MYEADGIAWSGETLARTQEVLRLEGVRLREDAVYDADHREEVDLLIELVEYAVLAKAAGRGDAKLKEIKAVLHEYCKAAYRSGE